MTYDVSDFGSFRFALVIAIDGNDQVADNKEKVHVD